MATQTTDPRITEILELAAAEGMPLALHPETIVALEDIGYIADPFTGALWRNPEEPSIFFAVPMPHDRAVYA